MFIFKFLIVKQKMKIYFSMDQFIIMHICNCIFDLIFYFHVLCSTAVLCCYCFVRLTKLCTYNNLFESNILHKTKEMFETSMYHLQCFIIKLLFLFTLFEIFSEAILEYFVNNCIVKNNIGLKCYCFFTKTQFCTKLKIIKKCSL